MPKLIVQTNSGEFVRELFPERASPVPWAFERDLAARISDAWQEAIEREGDEAHA